MALPPGIDFSMTAQVFESALPEDVVHDGFDDLIIGLLTLIPMASPTMLGELCGIWEWEVGCGQSRFSCFHLQ